MRITAKEQHGLRVVVELADQYGKGPIPLSAVAQSQDVSLDYLEQVVPLLRDAGLVNSTRGAKGGYELARHPGKITIGQVLRALDGDILPIRCVSHVNQDPCPRTKCGARTVWATIHGQILDTLDHMTLADL